MILLFSPVPASELSDRRRAQVPPGPGSLDSSITDAAGNGCGTGVGTVAGPPIHFGGVRGARVHPGAIAPPLPIRAAAHGMSPSSPFGVAVSQPECVKGAFRCPFSPIATVSRKAGQKRARSGWDTAATAEPRDNRKETNRATPHLARPARQDDLANVEMGSLFRCHSRGRSHLETPEPVRAHPTSRCMRPVQIMRIEHAPLIRVVRISSANEL